MLLREVEVLFLTNLHLEVNLLTSAALSFIFPFPKFPLDPPNFRECGNCQEISIIFPGNIGRKLVITFPLEAGNFPEIFDISGKYGKYFRFYKTYTVKDHSP